MANGQRSRVVGWIAAAATVGVQHRIVPERHCMTVAPVSHPANESGGRGAWWVGGNSVRRTATVPRSGDVGPTVDCTILIAKQSRCNTRAGGWPGLGRERTW